MFGLFKRKQASKPDCVHSWYLADYRTEYFNAGTSVDIEEVYVLGCKNCEVMRLETESGFRQLKRLGLIKGESE